MLVKYIECPSCGHGRNVNFNMNSKLKKEYMKCSSCNREYIYDEFFSTYLKNLEDGLFSNYIMADNTDSCGRKEVIIGNSYELDLVTPLKEIFLCKADTDGTFNALITYNNPIYEKEITKVTLMTSSISDVNNKLGEKGKVDIFIQGRSKINQLPTWFEFIVETIRLIKNKRYKIAVLTIEIALESYIDELLYKIFEAKGLNDKAINRILSGNISIDSKVNGLLKDIAEINIELENKGIKKKWKKIIEDRNKIAHGCNLEINYHKAIDCYQTIIDIIFLINRQSDIDLIYD